MSTNYIQGKLFLSQITKKKSLIQPLMTTDFVLKLYKRILESGRTRQGQNKVKTAIHQATCLYRWCTESWKQTEESITNPV